MRRRLTDPFVAGILLGIALVIAGFTTLYFAWRGVARQLLVPLQIPYAISGSFAAVGLIGLGVALLRVQADRLHAAQRRSAIDRLARQAAELLPLVRARYSSGAGTSRVKE